MQEESLNEAVARQLRTIRRERRLTLSDVARRSKDRFKISSLGGYERGERELSIERFYELSTLYGLPADALLQQILESVGREPRVRVTLDLTKLDVLPDKTRQEVQAFVDEIRTVRSDHNSEVITLRTGDLEALAMKLRIKPQSLVSRVRPALTT